MWLTTSDKAALRTGVHDVSSLPIPNNVRHEGMIFDELVQQYNTLAETAETMVVTHVCGVVEADVKAHLLR